MKKWAKMILPTMLFVFLLAGAKTMNVQAMSFEPIDVAHISNVSEFENADTCYTQSVALMRNDDRLEKSYLTFTLDAPSWVIFTGNYSAYERDGGQTHVDVFSDRALSNKKCELGWGYWEYNNDESIFLPAGDYYIYMWTKYANYDSFIGNVNLRAAYIPVSEVFDFKARPSADRRSATVTFEDKLGSHVKSVYYSTEAVSLNNVDNRSYWENSSSARQLRANGELFSFEAVKNGIYTVKIQDTDGKSYSKTVTVNNIDATKPTVSGVRNKKTYKKAVTIKFSDKGGSGIRSAKLNGRTIKNGKKITANGNYRLVVTDKAGNRTVISFKVRR